jgi:hypothetical protein
VVLIGLGLTGAGIAAVFITKNSAGAATLVGVGALLVLVGLLGDQLESLRYGDLELVLRRKADEAKGRGDLEAARAFEQAADTLRQRVTRSARSYKSVRSGMEAGPERTAKMNAIVADAKRDAHAYDTDEEEVLKLLWTGSEGARVWALGVLQERPELATPRAVLDAIQRPDEMFDQYQALVLAQAFLRLPVTRPWTRERVTNAVRSQRDSGALGTDRDCLDLAELILQGV